MKLNVVGTRVWYLVEPVTPEQAADRGCPDATLRAYIARAAGVAGMDGWHYGNLVPSGRVPGRPVTVPGARDQYGRPTRGVRCRFTYGGEALDVYVVNE